MAKRDRGECGAAVVHPTLQAEQVVMYLLTHAHSDNDADICVYSVSPADRQDGVLCLWG